MLASLQLAYSAPLRVEEMYAVSGAFTGLERKTGRRAGVFDLLSFELRLQAADGALAVVCTQAWVLPRRDVEPA